MAEFNNRPSLCDGRLLSRKSNAMGTPEMPLAEAATGAKEFDLGWKINGPRTAKWCLSYLSLLKDWDWKGITSVFDRSVGWTQVLRTFPDLHHAPTVAADR